MKIENSFPISADTNTEHVIEVGTQDDEVRGPIKYIRNRYNRNGKFDPLSSSQVKVEDLCLMVEVGALDKQFTPHQLSNMIKHLMDAFMVELG